jgi:phosphate-selective porin OprO/OprP
MGLPLIAPFVVAALLGSGPAAGVETLEQTQKPKPAAPQPTQKPAPVPQQPTPEPKEPPDRSSWLPPSFVFGDTARIDLRVKLHADQRSFSPDLRRVDRFDFRRARFGIEGDIKDNAIEYELEYDFREEDYPLRDAFVDIRALRAVQIRGGKFKLPFSREELTGVANLDFAFRSRAADQLSPGRSFGGMVHGRVLDRRMQYQVGLFREDGENARRDPERLDDGSEVVDVTRLGSWRSTPTWAARSTFEVSDDLEIAAATTLGEVPEGRNGLRGRMVFGGAFFPRLDVNGRRHRLGVEADYRTDKGSLTAEWIRVTDQRIGQGFDNEDLDAVTANGWYLSGTWLAIGPKPGDSDDRPAPRFGAIELAARIEGLAFGGPTSGGDPTRSPRAAVIVPNGERVATFGANWYINRFVRVVGNVIHEHLDDATRAPVPGQQSYWSTIVRLQFVL